jgi:hypothetical protein
MHVALLRWAVRLSSVTVVVVVACGDDPPAGVSTHPAAGGSGTAGKPTGESGSVAGGEAGDAGQAGAPGSSAGRGTGGTGRGGRGSGGSSVAGDGPDAGGSGVVSGAGGASGTAGKAPELGGEGGEAAGGEGGNGGSGVSAGGTAGAFAGTGGDSGASAGVGGNAGTGGTSGGSAGAAGGSGSAGTGGTLCSEPLDETCYSGPTGTRAVGICQDGRRYCAGGTCLGEVHPAVEACNGEDDDCDGTADDGFPAFDCGLGVCAGKNAACLGGNVSTCVVDPGTDEDDCNGLDDDCDGTVDEDCPTCIKVAPNGNDTAAAGSNGATPFATVQAAIDFADTHRNIATHVCVAAGDACRANRVGTYTGPITMRSGIDVAGQYESTTWKRCLDSRTTTILAPTTSEGVLFPAAIAARTALHDLIVDQPAGTTRAGITVDGALGAIVSGVTVRGGASTSSSYGVNVVNGADAIIVQSSVSGGSGTVESIGVRVVGARTWIDRSTIGGIGPGQSIGVLLQEAPTSRISFSTVTSASTAISASSFGVWITGDGSSVVVDHGSVDATGDTTNRDHERAGIRIDDCQGESPWIVANTSIGTSAGTSSAVSSFGVLARGNCHPSIDSNGRIRALSHGYRKPLAGVSCSSDGSASSRCTVSENSEISADVINANGGVDLVGVDCASCGRVSRNTAYARAPLSQTVSEFAALRRGTAIYGGQYVDRNSARGSCAPDSTGIAWGGRVVSNTVRGYDESTCPVFPPGTFPPRPSVSSETGIIGGQYVDSNVITVVTSQWSTTGEGALFGGGAYFGNRINMDARGRAYVRETSAASDPVRFLNNLFDGDASAPPLYRDFDTQTNINDIALVNSLPDVVSSGNLDLRN